MKFHQLRANRVNCAWISASLESIFPGNTSYTQNQFVSFAILYSNQ